MSFAWTQQKENHVFNYLSNTNHHASIENYAVCYLKHNTVNRITIVCRYTVISYFSVVQLHHLVDNTGIAVVLHNLDWGSLNIVAFT